MKKIYIIIASIVLFVSCGKEKTISVDTLVNKGDLKELHQKKKEISIKIEKLTADLSKIDTAIAKLDTVKKYPLVTTLVLKDTVFEHYIELQGGVKTKKNILVYPEMPGIITKIYVKKGQHVVKGQLLATIDDGGLSQRLAQVKTAAKLAKTTYERQKRLWAQKIGSEIQFLQAETNYKAQQSAVKQLEKQVAKSKIKAPFTGIIDDVSKEEGALVAPSMGGDIFRVINLKNMYIEVEVPETYITQIKKGKEVLVYFPILNKTLKTNISKVGSFINPANRSFKIEVAVPNNEGVLKPNLTAKVKINDYTNPKAILIPQGIISENAKGQQYVYLVTDKNKNIAVIKKTIIETGKTQKDVIEIIKGVTEGSEIINEGARSVHDGQKVAIKNEN